MAQFEAQMPSASSLFSAYASLSAFSMLLRSIFNDLLPAPFRDLLFSLFNRVFHRRTNHLTLVIEDSNATAIGRNQLYDAAEVYLTAKLTTPSTSRLKISKSPKDNSLTIRFHSGETINDSFHAIPLRWRFFTVKPTGGNPRKHHEGGIPIPIPSSDRENRYFELSFEKRHKEKVMEGYIPHVISSYNAILQGKRPLKLCTLGGGRGLGCGGVYWDSVNLQHPFTFDTLAMDPHQKSAIINDLDRFSRRREFFRKVGRAWKRGYLLYGPPGTGKSSLIAAIANHLRFDIYDLQLGNWMKDSDLRRLLLSTANRCILVIEDIDCSVEVSNSRGDYGPDCKRPEVQMTLSGLLNFIDGLWSSCGDQRIIIFTTNHKEKLDPALLRPGRMDMHIHMSYLTVQGFRVLASNYLGFKGQHRLSNEIEKLIATINVTPAQVAEELMRTEDVDIALEGVVKLLTTIAKEQRKGDDHSNPTTHLVSPSNQM